MRQRLVPESGDVPTEMYSLNKLINKANNPAQSEDTDFLDIWNMWPLQSGQFPLQETDSRQTHSVLVELVGDNLRLLYPLHNLPHFYTEPAREVEIFSVHHSVDVRLACVSLLQPAGEVSVSAKANKHWPLCVTSMEETGHSFTFYLFPVVKRNKELLYKLLQIRVGVMTRDHRLEIMVESVLRECRLLGQERSVEMINVLITRLGARPLVHQIVFNPVKKIFKKKLANKFSKLLKNLRLRDFNLGERFPVVKKISAPRVDERGVWPELDICCGAACSITIEANGVKLPHLGDTETEEDSSETDADSGSDKVSMAPAVLAEFLTGRSTTSPSPWTYSTWSWSC